MAIIGIKEVLRDDGRISNSRTGSFSCAKEITSAAAVDDVVALYRLNSNQVVTAYLRHSATDATLTMDFTLLPLGGDGHIATLPSGDPAIITPAYFATDVAFDTAKLEDYNISRNDILTEVHNINDILDGFYISQTFILCAVIKTASTGTIEFTVKGSTRGY